MIPNVTAPQQILRSIPRRVSALVANSKSMDAYILAIATKCMLPRLLLVNAFALSTPIVWFRCRAYATNRCASPRMPEQKVLIETWTILNNVAKVGRICRLLRGHVTIAYLPSNRYYFEEPLYDRVIVQVYSTQNDSLRSMKVINSTKFDDSMGVAG